MSFYKRWRILSANEDAPSAAGCYALVGNGETYYIGQSSRLIFRLREHAWAPANGGVNTKSWGFLPGAMVKIMAFPRGDFGYLTLEMKLINRLRPRFNVRHNRRNKIREDRQRIAPSFGPLPAYPGECKDLVTVESVARMLGISISQARTLFVSSMVEAVPADAVEWAIQKMGQA